MSIRPLRTLPLAPAALLALALLCPVAQADSLASSASSAGSASVGSSSTSIEKSSDSSSRDDKKDIAAGDYEVVEMAAMAERPGQLRLKLQPPAGAPGDRFYLYVPEATVIAARITQGQTLKALARPYGLAFAAVDANQDKAKARAEATPFFLVVQDTWLNELPSKAVTL